MVLYVESSPTYLVVAFTRPLVSTGPCKTSDPANDMVMMAKIMKNDLIIEKNE
jgi:hypothetical protein